MQSLRQKMLDNEDNILYTYALLMVAKYTQADELDDEDMQVAAELLVMLMKSGAFSPLDEEEVMSYVGFS